MNRSRSLTAFAVTAALTLAACGDDGPSRSDAVAAITTTAVPQRFDAFADAARELDVSVDDWCADGDGVELGTHVEATRLAWVSVLPFWFGPVMDRRSRFIVDPTVSTDDIVELIGSDEIIDSTALRDLYGTDQRGLAAVEELIAIAGSSTPEPRLCDYAQAAAGLVAEEADALAVEWAAAGPTFGADDAAANDALESMVNETLFGIVGLANDPAVDVAAAKLEAMRWTFLGGPTASTGNVEGIAALLDDDLVEQLTTEFDAAADLDADALMEVEVTITTGVVSALGLSVQFSDADGDG